MGGERWPCQLHQPRHFLPQNNPLIRRSAAMHNSQCAIAPRPVLQPVTPRHRALRVRNLGPHGCAVGTTCAGTPWRAHERACCYARRFPSGGATPARISARWRWRGAQGYTHSAHLRRARTCLKSPSRLRRFLRLCRSCTMHNAQFTMHNYHAGVAMRGRGRRLSVPKARPCTYLTPNSSFLIPHS